MRYAKHVDNKNAKTPIQRRTDLIAISSLGLQLSARRVFCLQMRTPKYIWAFCPDCVAPALQSSHWTLHVECCFEHFMCLIPDSRISSKIITHSTWPLETTLHAKYRSWQPLKLDNSPLIGNAVQQMFNYRWLDSNVALFRS